MEWNEGRPPLGVGFVYITSLKNFPSFSTL